MTGLGRWLAIAAVLASCWAPTEDPAHVPAPAQAPTPSREPATPTLAATRVRAEPRDAAAMVVPRASVTAQTRTRYAGSRSDDRVALSFDDGPTPQATRRVLQVLRLHDARATFFMLGEQVQRHPELAAEVARAGHELGNHGWSHRSWRSLFPSQLRAELDDTAAAIVAATGVQPRLARPPFGRFPASAEQLVHARGDDLVLWSVDSGDSAGADADTIAATVVERARAGDIVLLHDRDGRTVRALPAILAGLRRKQLRVVPVSELF